MGGVNTKNPLLTKIEWVIRAAYATVLQLPALWPT